MICLHPVTMRLTGDVILIIYIMYYIMCYIVKNGNDPDCDLGLARAGWLVLVVEDWGLT